MMERPEIKEGLSGRLSSSNGKIKEKKEKKE